MRHGLGFHNRHSPGGVFSPLSLFTGGVNGAWFDPSDSTTLFDDRAGTTPCAAPGAGAVVPVGLMLDKSQGLVLGANIQNGGFDSDTVWTKNGWTISGGTASYASGAGAAIEQLSPVTLAAGDFVKVTVTISAITAGFVYAWVAGNNTSSLGFSATRASTAGTYTWYFPIATVANQNVGIYCANGPTGIVIDNVSIQKVSGNHAIAANDTTARPELSARVNLLTYSEDFSNAAWVVASATKGTTTGTLPNGTTGTVHTLLLQNAINSYVYQNNPFASGQAATFAIYVRLPSGSTATDVRLTTNNNSSWNTGISQKFTLTSSWQRLPLSGVLTASGTLINVIVGNTDAAGNIDASIPAGLIEIWGADLRPTNIGSQIPAYQRVVDANTYDTVGFPRYLAANGTSSAMSTPANVNLSGTDKVTVFAGVRKLTDAGYQVITCNGTPTLENRKFAFFTTYNNSGDYAYQLAGSSFSTVGVAETVTQFAAPRTDVTTSQIAISVTPITDAIQLRVNGTNQTLNQLNAYATSATTFADAPLHIGRRANNDFFLAGNIYSLIVAGTAVSAANITATESWVNNKVGGVY